MIKSYSGQLVPYYVCILKHAGYQESASIELDRGEFFRPTDYQLIVNEKNDNDTPAMFSNARLLNINIIGRKTAASMNYLSIMLNRITDCSNKSLSIENMQKFLETYGRN